VNKPDGLFGPFYSTLIRCVYTGLQPCNSPNLQPYGSKMFWYGLERMMQLMIGIHTEFNSSYIGLDQTYGSDSSNLSVNVERGKNPRWFHTLKLFVVTIERDFFRFRILIWNPSKNTGKKTTWFQAQIQPHLYLFLRGSSVILTSPFAEACGLRAFHFWTHFLC